MSNGNLINSSAGWAGAGAMARLTNFYREWTIPSPSEESRTCDSVTLSSAAVRDMGCDSTYRAGLGGSMVRADGYCDYICS